MLAGPKSRDILAKSCPRDDVSPNALPWMRGKQVTIGHARAYAMAVSFSGELAFELHVPTEALYLAWQTLLNGGAKYHLKPFGLYAAESMRLEKRISSLKSNLLSNSPYESGLVMFVKMDKEAISSARTRSRHVMSIGNLSQCALMELTAPHGGDPIFAGDDQIGSITSSGYGAYWATIAYGFVKQGQICLIYQLAFCRSGTAAHKVGRGII